MSPLLLGAEITLTATIPTAATLLALASAALIGLSLLIGALALVLRAVEARKITLRIWLALAWLATLLVPALAWGVFTLSYTFVNQVKSNGAYQLDPAHYGTVSVAVPLAVFLVTMVSVAWLTGQTVLRPLATMRQAARQVAGGDLEFRLPDPPLREVAEVAEAFDAMGEALRHSIERQAGLEQQRRLLIGAVAHDLRTPLFALRGLLEGLERGLADMPDKTTRYLLLSRQQANTLERLVADLFSYARLEYLEEMPRHGPLDLAELLANAVECIQSRAEEQGIALAAYGPAACPLPGDAHLLTRAIENLLDNALRHTPTGGQIAISWERAIPEYRFRVADSGPGIAAADLPHIFDPLYRGETSRNRGTGGAGLGLAIARRILRAHGGDLTAATRPGGGAELVGTLPRLDDDACEPHGW